MVALIDLMMTLWQWYMEVIALTLMGLGLMLGAWVFYVLDAC